jgi:hypothetical protein
MKSGVLTAILVSAALWAAAFVIGWLLNREEYEAFWIVFSLCCARVLLPLLLPNRLAAAFCANDILLMGVGFIIGFWVGRGNFLYMHTVVKWTVSMMPAFIILGAPLAWLLNRWAMARRISGPYCRGCRYHLRGVTNWRCPECGRPFTLKELGVSTADLFVESQPTNAGPSSRTGLRIGD